MTTTTLCPTRTRAERDAYHADLARRRDNGDDSARRELTEANLALAAEIATPYAYRFPAHADDLHQEAQAGLFRATATFDPDLGTFSTHARPWIKRFVVDYCYDHLTTIRVPRGLQQGDDDKDPDQAPDRFAADARRARACRGEGRPGPGAVDPIADLVSPQPDPDATVLAAERTTALHDLLQRLRGRERLVLQLRFGLGDDDPMTLKAIGERLGLTKERVRQIEAKALATIRDQLARRDIHAAADL